MAGLMNEQIEATDEGLVRRHGAMMSVMMDRWTDESCRTGGWIGLVNGWMKDGAVSHY